MQEYFLTSSEILCSGLTAGNQSDWLPVTQNINHEFFIKISGISNSVKFKFECCPNITGNPGTDFVAVFSDDNTSITETNDGTYRYFFLDTRTGFIRLNFELADGGAPSIDCYYEGGR